MSAEMPNLEQQSQQAIARNLWVYSHIDLEIPFQRQVANSVRQDLGLAPLSEPKSHIPSPALKLATRISIRPPEIPDVGIEPTMKASVTGNQRGEQ
jgi:hypothetical protein